MINLPNYPLEALPKHFCALCNLRNTVNEKVMTRHLKITCHKLQDLHVKSPYSRNREPDINDRVRTVMYQRLFSLCIVVQGTVGTGVYVSDHEGCSL